MMYLGSSVDLLASYSFSAIRSSCTKCVELDEVGKVLALLYSVESIIPIFMTQVSDLPVHSVSVYEKSFILQIYASLWKATSAVPGIGETLWVGSFFFLSASLTVSAFLLSMMAWWKLKGRDINDLGQKTAATFKKTTDSNI